MPFDTSRRCKCSSANSSTAYARSSAASTSLPQRLWLCCNPPPISTHRLHSMIRPVVASALREKVYIVYVGRVSSICDSWNTCKSLVNGFPNAIHCKYSCEKEAFGSSRRFNAEKEWLSKMDSNLEEASTLVVVLDEILRDQQLNLLFIRLLLTQIRGGNKKRKRAGGEVLEEQIARIPAHVMHLSRLVNVTDRTCVDILRMDRNTFGRLCRLLRDRVGLFDQKFISIEEQVAMFLSVLAHHEKTRKVGFEFMRSSETVSKYCPPRSANASRHLSGKTHSC